MSSVFGTALSGLLAQDKRLEISASNVANLRSTGVRLDDPRPQPEAFVPYQVALTSDGAGGVRATAVRVTPPSVPAVEPGAPDADAQGIVARPNVSLEREMVTQIEALRLFQANLKVIETENRKLGALLDLIS
ncbi:MAG: flagellar basal body rod protein FlgC [Kiloniellaceae bacterium]